MNDRSLGLRFGIAWTLIGVVAVLAVPATWYASTHPRPEVTQKELDAARAEAAAKAAEAAGDQNLYAQCEAQITKVVTDNYGTVGPYKHLGVKYDGDTAKATVKVKSSIYNGNLTCKFKRSNWQLGEVAP